MNIELADRSKCYGCSACESICSSKAITMEYDVEGFLYPVIDRKRCTNCGQCKTVCIGSSSGGTGKCLTEPAVYGVKHSSKDTRVSSTSGGVFTALSDVILREKGIIYGAAFDSAIRVCHQRAETAEGRNKFKGSKYVQSDIRGIYSQVKKDLLGGKSVLFTGTPCQVAGLYHFLLKTNTEKLVTIDLVCHGTPSPKVFADFIKYCERKNNSKIDEYYCRSKENGWHVHTEKVIFSDGSQDYKSRTSQLFKVLFYSSLILRPSCYQCGYANFNRIGDITIGDFWGIEKIMPAFDDNLGVSLVLLNTDKGEALFVASGESLISVRSDINNCIQPTLQHPTFVSQEKRRCFWNEYQAKGFEYVCKKYTDYGLGHFVLSRAKRLMPLSLKQALKKIGG